MMAILGQRRFAAALAATTLAALALAGCIGGDRAGERAAQMRSRPSPSATPGAAPSIAGAQCRAALIDAEIRFSVLPDAERGGGCRTIDTVKLLEFGTPTTNLGPMTCDLARAFTSWVRYAARPAALRFMGSELVRVETMGTYSCRAIGGGSSGRLSQHGFANAVDVGAFVLADGRRISVRDGWNGGEAERRMLRAVHASACRRFGTVLGPDYNAAHHDHLHLDMAPGRFCR